MVVYYLDTSALVKRYAREEGTAWILSLTDVTAEHDLYTVRMTGPEMIAALFRKARTGEISPDDASRSAESFRADWRRQYQIGEVTALVADKAMELAEKHGLRGYDAVHLASAVVLQQMREARELPSLTFVSAGAQQRETAAVEGLPVEDPNEHH
ncbi:MAG: type II toxin-antitoxin system VapC family toxin [Anaerolineae bacterium]